MISKSTILAGQFDHVVWIRVDGRGTFQVSGGLRDYTRRMMQRGHTRFVMDLEGCDNMDSTFMGTLAGIALRLRDIESGSISLLHANARNRQLLENLGLDHLFSWDLPDNINPHGVPERVQLGSAIESSRGEEAQRKTMISAHEALVEAAPENEGKFRDVLELLKSEAPQGQSGG